MSRKKKEPGDHLLSILIRFGQVTTTEPSLKRKGELLSLYIALILVLLLYTIINNIVYLIFHPIMEYVIYLFQEILIAALFMVFWGLNKKGYVLPVGLSSIAITILLAVFVSDARYLEYSMVIFAIPVGISSFIIRPYISILFASLTAAAYGILTIVTGYTWEYNLTAILALFSLAFLTWVISLQLESALEKNDKLVTDVQKAYQEIKDAYATTLEGWSHAMEIRDRETQGHSKRVTELTIRMARRMGFSEEELVHIYRGALLHDIGKLGIPDDILNKPGPLDEHEMNIMRLHPQIAVDLISPIDYLKPALNIPRYHHEKWDGTGYPHGLVGETIPLEARIYAIIDVYDALTHDRPYRQKMSEKDALEFIKSQAGTHFDPAVLEVFLKEIEAK
ncbi:MAG: HD-GYP domain-containing protein [Chloroflexota bacterium]